MAWQYAGQVVTLDDFARPGTPTWEDERFIDEVLRPLREGREASYQRWPHDAATPVGAGVVAPGGLVIVEGVSALALAVVERVGRWWDLSLWLDVSEEERRRRISARDGDGLAERWVDEWWPSERRYFRDERPLDRADFIIRG